MYNLTGLCSICLKRETHLRRLFNSCENVNYYSKLVLLFPEMTSTVLYNQGAICTECCSKVDDFYEYRKQCLQNSQIYIKYTLQLSSASKISDKLCNDLTISMEEQKQPLMNFEEIEKSYNSNNLLKEGNSSELFLKKALEKPYNNSYPVKTENGDYTVPREEARDDAYLYTNSNNINIEEVYIKSERADTSECEGDELENVIVTNTASATSSSNPDESCLSLSVNMFKHINTTRTIDAYHKCDVCEKTFSQARDLAAHKPVHTDKKRLKCEQCDKAFTSISHLIIHKRSHSGEKPFKCEQCGKAFTQSSSLITHRKIHSGEKPFKCDQCDKAFLKSSNLNNHKRIHSGDKPFKCDQCGKAFAQSSSLITHRRTHSGEKPYSCDQCNKAYSHSSDLIIHKRKHSGKKPFTCDQCSKAFVSSSNLKKHKQTHLGEKQFKCDQ